MHRCVRDILDQRGQIVGHGGVCHVHIPARPSVIAQIGRHHMIFFRQTPGNRRPVARLPEQTMDDYNGSFVAVFFAKGVMGKLHWLMSPGYA